MEYKTHTNLILALIEDADGCRVTLTGDREKLVWQGTDRLEAQRVFDGERSAYEKRRKEETEAPA